MPDYNFKNNLKSTLQSKLWSDATSIYCNHVVESEDADTRRNAWPAFPFTLTIVDTANAHIEIIKCTSLANNSSDAIVFHCDRAQESTTAQTFEIATRVEHRLTSEALNSITNAVSPATTTARGIGRVATLADMEPGAVVENGPAFLAAGTFQFTTTPTAHAVPQANANGKLDAWVSPDAGKANNDLSNLNPAAEKVIRSKTALRTLGTRGTNGSWTITDVEINRPLMIFVVGYTGGGLIYARLIPQSNLLPTGDWILGAPSSTEAYALGLSAIYVPSSATVVISVTSISSSLSLVAKQ